MKDLLVQLDDGRELAFAEIGDPEGACIFFFHGAPMSRLHLTVLHEQFAGRGLRVIAPDRPGYGRSSPHPGRSLLSWPPDVAALADALLIDRFLVAAHSSGGPYAVACAALLPERVTAGAVVAGVTDMAWPDAWHDYPKDEVPMMLAPDETAATAWCADHYGVDGAGFLAAEPFDFPEPDIAVLGDKMFSQALIEAFRQGVTGYAQDLYIQGRPWPFDPGSISTRFEILHGELDNLISIAHSRHTAKLIPSAVLRILPGHGHLSILSELPAIASALRQAGDAPH